MKYLFLSISLTLFLPFGLTGQAASETPVDIPSGWWQIPKTSSRIKLGGYVKLDIIHDFNPINSPDFFDVSKIPTDGSKGESTHLHAKETRFYIDVRTPFKNSEIKTYVEGDFYGTSSAFRLRHAYIEIENTWLAGQTWSNFMDENIIPATLDYEKPAAYAFVRHAMLRWKHPLSTSSYLSVAIEEPSTNAQPPSAPGKFESPLPDLTARFRITKNWGHIQLSAFAAQLRYRYSAGGTDNISLFGGNLSGQLNLLQADKMIYQVVYGPGVSRYRGGLSAVPDASDNLQAPSELGITLGYEHHWNEKWTSLVLFNHGSVEDTNGQSLSDLSQASYIAANLLCHFTKNAFAGIEYLYGLRKDFSGDEGTANRIQFSISYTFN
jgi:hypothetical protein